MTHTPLFTIITVVFNSVETIEKTIKSVIEQENTDFEYIIIDGGSTDGTVGCVQQYEDKISYWVTEKDNGIYDAMNKGIKQAKGEWIIFMNAGDCFVNNQILTNVLQTIDKSNLHNVDILYGDSTAVYQNGSKKLYIASDYVKKQWKGPIFRHGAMFVKAHLQKEYPFILDKKYAVCADFEFIYHMVHLNKTFANLRQEIIHFQAEGVSADRVRCAKDNRMIVLSYSNKIHYRIWHLYWIIRAYMIDFVVMPLLKRIH